MKYKDDFCAIVIAIVSSTVYNEEQMIERFHSDNCMALECKPKLFFILKVSMVTYTFLMEIDNTNSSF